MAEKYSNKCSKSLVIREMHIKTVLRIFHLWEWLRSKPQRTVFAEKLWSKVNTSSLLVSMHTSTVTVEINVVVYQKTGNQSTTRPSYIPLEHLLKLFSIMWPHCLSGTQTGTAHSRPRIALWYIEWYCAEQTKSNSLGHILRFHREDQEVSDKPLNRITQSLDPKP